ncbi:MAG: type I restriction enzyme HsdR N-terminal domain-containing protein [Prevotellaceae bacterium]|nr:type I restriction enzyme HsdR N-terminal domain-containing protein [Prevotellaceae bacterium]
MPPLNLPAFEVRVAQRSGKPVIFDFIRRTYVALTPEEWVRQHFVHYLVGQKRFPAGLMANEVTAAYNGIKRRCDTVLYRRNLTPFMIVEYKAPSVRITQAVFEQITRYNMVLHVDYLVVSNGLQHYCCRIDYKENRYTFLEDIPMYEEMGAPPV